VPVAGGDVTNIIIIIEANKINLELKIERIQLGEKRIGEGCYCYEVVVIVIVVHGDVSSVVGLIGLGLGMVVIVCGGDCWLLLLTWCGDVVVVVGQMDMVVKGKVRECWQKLNLIYLVIFPCCALALYRAGFLNLANFLCTI